MKPGRVLVVDDDDDVLSIFRDILESKGYIVETAETGAGGVDKAVKGDFDVALVDIRLPDIEGTEVLRLMRGRTGGMKKVIVTGYPSLENAIESITHGVDAYLLKPVPPAELLRVVEGKLGEKRGEDTLLERALQERMASRKLGRAGRSKTSNRRTRRRISK